ncbi:MAG: MFS transporter [Promethearchaeota archaeon]
MTKEYKKTPPFFKALMHTLKNKAFVLYLPTNLGTWFVFGMLPTIIPLYGRFVLGIEKNSILLGLMLAIAFITAGVSMPFWAWVAKKVGARMAWIISLGCWILTLMPFMFITSEIAAFIIFAGVGFNMAGSLLMKDVIFSDIIDSDELVTKVRREAGYFGIDFFFARLATILVFVAIGSVFNDIGWKVYDPLIVDEKTIFGLKALIFIFPAIALGIGILFMFLYPKEKLNELHKLKKNQENLD